MNESLKNSPESGQDATAVDTRCVSCRTPKTTTECEVCFEPLCKKCVLTLSPDRFSLMLGAPEVLQKYRFCQPCYDSLIAPEAERYDETVERAKQVIFLTDTYKGYLPVQKKAKLSVSVKGCVDRDEVVMRLAFMAAQQGFNSLIKSDVKAIKIRKDAAYQTSEWQGHGTPADVDESRLVQDEIREEVWRRGK